MPKGTPSAGFRMTKRRAIMQHLGLDGKEHLNADEKAAIAKLCELPKSAVFKACGVPSIVKSSSTAVVKIAPATIDQLPLETNTNETYHESSCRISERFVMMSTLVDACIGGDIRAMIVSGPPGVGKSYMIETKLREYDENGGTYSIVSGRIKATGLYRKLYEHRHEGNVLVLDDADEVFFDATSLNILKAACDTKNKRAISYLAENDFVDEDGELIPRSFEFEGTVIFVTNYDLDTEIKRGTKIAPHLQAMASRAMYFDVGLQSRRDCLVRIKQVIDVATQRELSIEDVTEIMAYLEANLERVRELSIRTALKIAKLRKINPNWKALADIAICKK